MFGTQRSGTYRGVVIGSVSGLVGLLAMGQFWTRVAPLLVPSGEDQQPPEHDRNIISPLGQQHQPGESSTAALGRTLYEKVEGHHPDQQTETALSEAVHWSFGALNGAAYGAVAQGRAMNPLTGVLFGAGLWAVADEGLVPLLGLQDGPRASDMKQHLSRLGAHVAYGLGLGLSAWLLDRVLPE